MDTFGYSSPSTVSEAVSLLSAGRGTSRPFAGGTDLLVQLRSGSFRPFPDLLVDVKNIPELMRLAFDPKDGLIIGAAVTCADLCRNPEVTGRYPGLVDGVSLIGGRAIQERATVGGNLCNAAPSADAIPALLVLGALCTIAGRGGNRTVPVEKFCTAPGKTILSDGELLEKIIVPVQPNRSSSAYLRFTPRHEMDIAVAGAAAWLAVDERGERIVEARLALSAVAPVPLVVDEAADSLKGGGFDEATIERAAELAAGMCEPISDVRGGADFRRHLIRILVRRSLRIAYDRIEKEAIR